MKTCISCGVNFEFSKKDRDLLDKCVPLIDGQKYPLPEPEICPRCSLQHRQTFRNESSLYHRTCSKTGKKIIAMYPQDAPFPVYSPEVWFGDSWEAKDYGQEFDFDKPFFEQFLELRNKVPHLSLISSNNENCDFCNIVGDCKNCYLTYGSVECQDCYYGSPFNCKGCVDSLLLRDSELCLECSDSSKLYESFFCENCSNSKNLYFCSGVKNSSDCIGCVNINRGKYQIFNQQYSGEDYGKFLAQMDLSKPEILKSIWDRLNQLKLQRPHRFYVGTNNENVSGDYIFNSKDCFNSFGISGCRDMSGCFQMLKSNDCLNVSNGEFGELNYEIMAYFSEVSHCSFCYFIWEGMDSLYYSAHCNKNVKDCFGCIGLKHAQYCILNKQYTKEQYEQLVPKIIGHMRKTGEWGKSFPEKISPFKYAETVANDFFPLEKSKDKDFKIIPQEKAFYEKYKMPLPKHSPKQRNLDRIARRNPIMTLNQRKCDRCKVEMLTSYTCDSKFKIYCEKCYLEAVY